MFTPKAIGVFLQDYLDTFLGRQIQLIWATKLRNEAMKA
jgi:hypothetical protein